MPDPVRLLQQELRGSMWPVSAFFLVDSDSAVSRLAESLDCLSGYGLIAEWRQAVINLTLQMWEQSGASEMAEERRTVEFTVGSERKTGMVQIRPMPDRRLEVELILPGIVASSATGFLDRGFFCAFMPPSFYD